MNSPKLMMEFKDHFFLDTSTQISRHWADEETNKKVRADLFGKKLQCSIYVEREYCTKVVNTIIVIYNLLRKFEDIDAAKDHAEKLKREAVIDALTYNVIRRLFNKFNSVMPILRRLRDLIDGAWENFFYDGGIPKELVDTTGCTRGAEVPRRLPQGYYLSIPTKCPDTCKIYDFWQTKQDDLQNLSKVDTSKFTKTNDPDETMRQIQNESQAILGGKSPHGDSCRIVSDAVISIEARDSYPGITIHTMDYDLELLKGILNTQVRLFKA
jgi:hypothetical protein